MFQFIDFETLRFGQPGALWLLAIPSTLLLLWVRLLLKRSGDRRRLKRQRTIPPRERFPLVGGLLFWLCLILALACTIVALGEPRALISVVRTAGIDVVVLQDGSASMHVKDVAGDRWQRSIRFLRELAESLRWKDDRLAMALFAHIAAPQVRLTNDPNTFFFFLDHLAKGSPFRLEDDTTWDTNIELGIYWGLRLIQKDEQLHGPSRNAKVFVLLSDGQAWSGAVENSLKVARQRGLPLYVVGVGTTAGGRIPDAVPAGAVRPTADETTPLYSRLDRASLRTIAIAGGGQYFELESDNDRQVANAIVEATRRRSGTRGEEETTQDLYWRFLAAAVLFVLVGCVFLRERVELWVQLAGIAAALAVQAALVP